MNTIIARTNLLQLRLSADELDAIRLRAGDQPASTWLRRVALDQPAPMVRRRIVRERPLHPQARELVRIVVMTSNQLRQISEQISRNSACSQSTEALADALMRLSCDLRNVLEVAQC